MTVRLSLLLGIGGGGVVDHQRCADGRKMRALSGALAPAVAAKPHARSASYYLYLAYGVHRRYAPQGASFV
jgi:hypothetical protein